MQRILPAGTSRNWPFCLRISFQERCILQKAARRRGQSYAEIVRTALDPLIRKLETENAENVRLDQQTCSG